MDSRYKAIISNRNLYKEIEFSPDAEVIKMGTGIDCNVRLRKELFFGPIELCFVKNESGWSVLCSDNLYLTVGDVRKMMTKDLQHGDILFVRYQDSDTEVFSIEFLYDFDNGRKKYERLIDIAGVDSFTIGGNGRCRIAFSSPFVSNDLISVQKKGTSLMFRIERTTYGVYHNGSKAETVEEIKNGDFFSISDFFFYYKDDIIRTEIRDDLFVNSLTYRDMPSHPDYPKFKRNTRVKHAVNNEKIEVLDPPAKPQKPKNNIVSRLLPSLVMVGAGLAMSFISPFMLVSSGVGVVTAIISIIQSNRDFKKDTADRIVKYNNYISKKRAEIMQNRAEEQKTLEEIYISQQEEQNRFDSFSSDLFDRAKGDEDFLCVRLGSGDIDAKREVNYKKQEKLEIEDDLQAMPGKISEEFKKVHNAPVVCDFKKANAVGVIGPEASRFEIMKNMVVDIAARQYFSDVKMFFVADSTHSERIHWLRMLPHVYNDALGIRNIVCDDESKNVVFEYLYKELTSREQRKAFDEQIVVFFYDEYGFQTHPISRFIDKASSLGVTFVFFGDKRGDIPTGCKYLVEIQEEKKATLVDTGDSTSSISFEYPTISNERAESIVSLLAPVYTEEISLEGSLTKSISMFELLNIIAVDDINLEKRWASSQVYKSMSAPIGVSKTGIVSLDLHDKAHGPHGLVAGTTGSGKSELLQTYILAMATLYHPYEVGFVIIDFKGGGMADQFRELPHLLGAITNIDGKAINRSLKSIRAELQKRQKLFAEAGKEVNHIDKYIRKYKAGMVSIPLPHLIIIVDEFAELKAQQPEFMKELISAARIGRSLGVHLILATQKPSGQVNEQIWSNSRFKLCLKVQSQEDSNEMLKSPLAAEIKEPGRAYLQVGNNEIFELFQSAYSGAPEVTDDSGVKEFTIYNLNDSGKRIPVYSQKKKKKSEDNSENNEEGNGTQLFALVKHISDHCKDINLPKLPDICLPALKEKIPFPEIKECTKSTEDVVVEVGVYDDPDNQYQGKYTLNLEDNNTVILGSSQSGKTNLLQTVIRGLAEKYSPSEVNIYIIDFASMILKNFEKLNHVGGVVTASEDEKFKNLFKLLYEEINRRKKLLLAFGVSSFSAYKEAGKDDIPQIILIIENLITVKELYFQNDDSLLGILREGPTFGVSVIATCLQMTSVGYRYLSNFSNRIAFFCNDSSDYGTIFDHCRDTIDSIPGRCLIELEKNHFECQTYLSFEGEKEIDRVHRVGEFIDEINRRYPETRAPRIPVIPEVVSEAFILDNFADKMKKRFKLVVGLDYNTVSPYVLDFAGIPALGVTGRQDAGVYGFVQYLVRMLEKVYPDQSEVYIVDDVSRGLQVLKDEINVAGYSTFADQAEVFINSIGQELANRYEALASGNDDILNDTKLLVLILNNSDSLQLIGKNDNLLNLYKAFTGKYKALNVFSLVVCENTIIPVSAYALRDIRDNAHFMIFEDLGNIKVCDVPFGFKQENKKALEAGDGYYIRGKDIVKLKTSFYDSKSE